MQSNNPVLRRAVETAAENRGLHEEGQAAYAQADAQQLEHSFAGAAFGERTLQMPDVVAKTAISLLLVAAGAVIGWQNVGLGLLGMVVGLVLGFVNAMKKQVVPALVIVYAAAEGLFLGAISRIFSDAYAVKAPNLVGQAVLGTVVAFAVMLALYSNRIVRVNGKFTKILMASFIAYGLIGLVSFVSSFMGVGQGWGFYGVGQLGLLLCLAGVVLAAFTLALDFDLIEQGIRFGLPERESWRMAYALTSTLVWLYVEVLRFLAILTNRR
ncbi:MAG: Bax inhibitor-1/YccA family protein [Candidatus Nanopelagicales bacterium]